MSSAKCGHLVSSVWPTNFHLQIHIFFPLLFVSVRRETEDCSKTENLRRIENIKTICTYYFFVFVFGYRSECVCVWAGAEDRVFAYYTLFLFWAEQCKRARTMTAQQRRGKNSKHKWNVYQDVHESRNGRKSKHAPVKSTFLYVLVYGGSPCNSISHHQIVRPNRKWKEERKSNFVEIKDTRTDSPVMHAKSKFHKKRGEKINHIFHSSFGIMDLALDSTSFTEKVK